jgi:hypothetical protein
VCDNVPEPGLEWGDTVGYFTGHNVTNLWSCPTWFDPSVCDNVVAVCRDRFYCPWFRTYEEALAADYTCTFAP